MLTPAQQEAAMALWDDLADFPAAHTETALQHLMQTFCEWLEADNAVWLGAARLMSGAAARRDLLHGWRVLARRGFNDTPSREQRAQMAARTHDTAPTMTTLALAEGMGKFRIHRLHDGFVDLEAFQATPQYRAFYLENGIQDRMYIGFPINAETESFFLFDRLEGRPHFTAADVEMVAFAMRGLKWFHREVMLSHGLLLATQPLSAVERRIASLLLTDCIEKEIAEKVGQSPKTTHKYITEILRKFGVRGRTGLMALWLGRSG